MKHPVLFSLGWALIAFAAALIVKVVLMLS